ncbi:MAG: MOSC domain-containing protein [Bryobacterales bacterium]|nr:MOSC domain-containing protein [Bryobacterales bacterium]
MQIGTIEAIFQYPVKSMAGVPRMSARLGWNGLEGDRRLALQRLQDSSGMPWLTAGKLPDLLRYTPRTGEGEELPTHVRTPEGQDLPIFGEELTVDIVRRYRAAVRMAHLRNGIFDEASISVITTDTVEEIGRLAGRELEPLQFRPNLVVRLREAATFAEDKWVGGRLSFGEGNDAPEIAVTLRDIRCGMVNLDPYSAQPHPEVMKAIVRANDNHAGIYAAVTRLGQIAVGQPVFHRA